MSADVTFRAMGSEIRLIVGDPGPAGIDPGAAVDDARDFIEEFEQCLSRFRPDSELCALNAYVGDVVPASPLLRDAVSAGVAAAERTGGLVDPTLVDEIETAGYVASREGASPVRLADALALAPARVPARGNPARRWAMITVDEEAGVIRRPAGTRFDSGGIGKGLAADLLAERLAGQTRFVIGCGGDLRVGGTEPESFEVLVEHPLTGEQDQRIRMDGGAVATSGLNVRVWRRADGHYAHHLIDPWTGEPAWTGLVGATALAPTGVEAETRRQGGAALRARGRPAAPRRTRRRDLSRGRRGRAGRPDRHRAEADPGGSGGAAEGGGGMTPAVHDHVWWLASRASGLVALGLITASVVLGLLMSAKVMRKPGRARTMVALHEQLALGGLLAIAIHGITLLGDAFLNPGLKGILLPGAIDYRPLWVGLGIGSGYLAAALGLSFYARKSIGPRLWRKAHRATIVVYGLAVAHTLGAGTDASTPWLRAWLYVTAPLVAGLLVVRMTEPWRRRRRAAARPPRPAPTIAPAPGPAADLADAGTGPGPGAAADPGRDGAGGMSADRNGVVIAGGGLAAQRCAETLRKRGYEAPVRIVAAEDEAPYDRPPLSKDVAAGAADGESVRFRDRGWYDDNAVELLLGRRAAGLDPGTRRLDLDDGSALGYDDLLIATGAAPRSLPMLAGYENAFPLRTLADARRLNGELRPGARLAIVGAGFIGQEVAATARAEGVEVTIVEALDLPLEAILGADVGRWIVDTHRDEGVRVLTGAMLTAAAGNGRVEQLTLGDGERLDCDAVVVGVGVAPAAGWVAGSGLDPAGIATDAAGRTAIPHIYAAGDVSRPFDARRGEHVRTEHWDAASRQGVAVAAAILGETPRPPALPSFWSDQYGLRIQYVGHAEGADEARISGDPGARDFHVLYQRGGRPVAALAVGRPRELAAMRRLIESDGETDPQPTDSHEAPTKEMSR